MKIWIVTEYDCEGVGTPIGAFDSEDKATAARVAHANKEAERARADAVRRETSNSPVVRLDGCFHEMLNGGRPAPKLTPNDYAERRRGRVLGDTQVEDHEVL
jgi:hypothetical protein